MLLVVLFLFFTFFPNSHSVLAQFSSPTQESVIVSAVVGDYLLSVSGIASKFASIILTSEDNKLVELHANSKGEFEQKDIFIKKGFSDLCMETIDAHKIGKSYTCISFTPAQGDIRKDGIFLPPSLAVSSREVIVGKNVPISGYSMPGAKIEILVDKRAYASVFTDREGYYTASLERLTVGQHEITSYAILNGKTSLMPTRLVKITVFSLLQGLGAIVGDFLNTIPRQTVLWIGLTVVILIIILLTIVTIKARKRN